MAAIASRRSSHSASSWRRWASLESGARLRDTSTETGRAKRRSPEKFIPIRLGEIPSVRVFGCGQGTASSRNLPDHPDSAGRTFRTSRLPTPKSVVTHLGVEKMPPFRDRTSRRNLPRLARRFPEIFRGTAVFSRRIQARDDSHAPCRLCRKTGKERLLHG